MPDLPKRKFTKSQQSRLDAIPGKLDDILSGYEKNRKAYESQKALDPNTPTNPLVLKSPLLKYKFKEFTDEVVRIWVNINQSLELDQFSDQLESDARDFKKWLSEELRRRIHKDHLPFLDWAAIEKAVDDEVKYWVDEKQRAIPVPRPWDPSAEPPQAQPAGQPADTEKKAITKVRQSILSQLQRTLELDKRDFLAARLGTDPSTLRAIARCDFGSHGGRDAEESLFELLKEHGLDKEWGPRFPSPGSIV